VLVVPLVCRHHDDVNDRKVVLDDGGAGHFHLVEHVDVDHEHDDARLQGVFAGGDTWEQFGGGEHDRVGFRRVQ
jgi:hypothetical protein